MKATLHLTPPLAAPNMGRIAPRRPSVLAVCAALVLTLAGLLGLEGQSNGE